MTEVITNVPVLADSTFRTRPNFQLYLRSDANAGGNTVQQIQTHRRNRQMKFPSLHGRGDVDSFQTSKIDNAFKRWNDEGDFRPPAPYRDYDNIVDPVSGFVSAGGDVDRNTGHKKINSLVQLNDVPQAEPPQKKNSDRLADEKAPTPLRRSNTYAPGAPSMWNSRKISDEWIKSQLGGMLVYVIAFSFKNYCVPVNNTPYFVFHKTLSNDLIVTNYNKMFMVFCT